MDGPRRQSRRGGEEVVRVGGAVVNIDTVALSRSGDPVAEMFGMPDDVIQVNKRRMLEGEAENRTLLGGRFLQSSLEAHGAFPLETLWTLGFDRRWGEYTVLGMDTMGTYMVAAAGPPPPPRAPPAPPHARTSPSREGRPRVPEGYRFARREGEPVSTGTRRQTR